MFGCGGGAVVFRFIRHDSFRPRTASAAGSEKVAEVPAQLFFCFEHSLGWFPRLSFPPLSSVPSGLVFRPHGSVASREVSPVRPHMLRNPVAARIISLGKSEVAGAFELE